MPIALPAKPPLIGVPVSRALWRLHRNNLGAIWFGPGAEAKGRFDDPALGFGVLYLGETPGVTVLETLVRGTSRCTVARADWKSCAISRVRLAEKLQMLQLEGRRLPEFGIGAERAHSSVYDECQAFSAEVHASLPNVDGIQYRSRWDPSCLCWAVFDRAAHKIAGADPSDPLHGSAISDEVLDTYPILVV
jgi:hypothetical protein